MEKQPEELTEDEQVAEALEIKKPDVDLTAQRDSRVLPLVSYLFGQLGSFWFSFNDDVEGKDEKKIKAENESYNAFYEDVFITSLLERDLQMKDISYLFTMMKTAVAVIEEVLDEPVYSERVKDCAREVFELMALEKTLNLAHLDDKDKLLTVYRDIYIRVIEPTFNKHAIRYNEVSLVFTIMKAMLAQIEVRADNTISMVRKVADANAYGIEDIDELTVNMVQNMAQSKV